MKMRKYYIILCLLIVELSVAGYITTNHPIITEKTMTKREYTKPKLKELSPECGVIHGQIQDMFDDGGTLEWRCQSCGVVFYPPTVARPVPPA